MANLALQKRMIWVHCDYISQTTGEVTHRAKHFVEYDPSGPHDFRKKSLDWLKANGPDPDLGSPYPWVNGWEGQPLNGQKEVFGPVLPV